MPERPATFRDIITHEAKAAGIPPEVAFAIVDVESAGDPTAIGGPTKVGRARGFFQLMPDTAKRYGVDPADPIQNIQGGIRMLSDLNRQYNGDVEKMLLAYHGGQDPRNHGPVTQAYAQKVLGRMQAGEPSLIPADGPRASARGFKANPTEQAKKIGAPPPAPLPELQRTAVPDPAQFERTIPQRLVGEVGPYVTPALGSLAGGIAGAAVGGPPGAFAGATTGGVLGEKAQIELEKLVGLPPPQNELTRLGTAAAGGILGEGIGQAGIKLAAPFAKKVTAEGLEALKALKGKVLPSQVTDAWLLDIADNIATGALIGGGKMAGTRTVQQQAIDVLAEQTANRIGTAVSMEEAGTAFMAALDTSVEKFGKAASKLYDVVDATTTEAVVPTSGLLQFTEAELTKRGGAVPRTLTGKSGQEMLTEFHALAKDIVKETPASTLVDEFGRPLREATTAELPRFITFSSANFMRQQLNAKIRQFNFEHDSVASGVAQQIVKRLDGMMENAAKTLTPAGYRAWRFATAFYKEGIARYQSKVIRELADNHPSKLIDALMVSRAAVEPIRAARKAIEPAAWEKVRGAAAGRLIEGATKENLVHGDLLAQQLRTLGKPAVRELFGGDAEDLYRLARVIQTVQGPQATGIGKMFIQLQQARGLTQAAAGAFGLASGNVGWVVPVLLAPEVIARVMTHPKGIKWLTTGIELGPTSKAGARALGQLITAVGRPTINRALAAQDQRRKNFGPPPQPAEINLSISNAASPIGQPPPVPPR